MSRVSRFQFQPDLFIADASFIRSKELTPLMGTNWFSISKNPRFVPIIHEYDKYQVEIEARSEYGLATIWDNDLLIFLVSQLVNAADNGIKTSPRIQFTGYDYFRFLRREWRGGITGKHSYDLLLAALRRLQGTFIKTNIKPTPEIESGGIEFYWLAHLEHLKLRNDDTVGYEVHIDQKLHDWAVDRDPETGKLRNVLTLDPYYFDITGGLERWLYLWARKSAGFQKSGTWTESYSSLREKSGTTRGDRQFRYHLRQILKRNALPGYEISEMWSPKGPRLEVRRRSGTDLLMKPKQLALLPPD